jgi:hypothetical protein
VGAVGHEYAFALRLAFVAEVGGSDEEGGEFTLGAGGRLERAGVEAGDFAEDLLHLEEELQHPLAGVVVLEGVDGGEARQRREALVPLGVVLHGTRPQRVEVGVDRHVPRRQVGEVADQVDLADLGQRRR